MVGVAVLAIAVLLAVATVVDSDVAVLVGVFSASSVGVGLVVPVGVLFGAGRSATVHNSRPVMPSSAEKKICVSTRVK